MCSGMTEPRANWPALAGDVARALLGEPSSSTRAELRFGRRGSLSVDLRRGVWHDHEAGELGAPELRKDGQPRRRKSGAIVRSGHDTVPNPAARYVAPLTDADLTRMIGFDGNGKRRRHDARRAFDRLHTDGVIDLRREGRGYLVFGPRVPIEGETV